MDPYRTLTLYLVSSENTQQPFMSTVDSSHNKVTFQNPECTLQSQGIPGFNILPFKKAE